MVKRFLSFFCALATVFLSVSLSFALDVSTPVQGGSISPVEQDYDVEWFCEEHQQPLIPEDEIPEGYEQICLQCNSVNQISTFAAGDETGVVPISFVSWAVPGDNLWHSAPSVIGTGGVVAYYIGQDWSSTVNSVDVRIVFSAPVSFTPPDTDSMMNPYFNLNVGVFNLEYGGNFSFLSVPGTPTGTSIYTMYSYDNSTYSTFGKFKYTTSSGNVSRLSNYRLSGFGSAPNSVTSNQIFYNFKFGDGFTTPNNAAFYVSDFGLSFGSPDDVQPGQPGTLPDDSISQSWLGGLFDTIFGGIQEIVSGIENLPQSIASGLQSLFDGVTNAVNSIGSAITGAVDAASSAISSAVDSASSAITGIIGQQWNDQSGHNDEIDQAVSDLENQDQQMGQVEDQYLDDFHEQQSSMAGTVSTFQWPSGITSAMAWITIQMNTIWSGLGGNVQMLFTFSMILGLSLIFLGRWRA